MIRLPLIPLLTLAAGALSAASTRPMQPETMPVCASPQQISPAVPLGGSHRTTASMLWNGTDFAVAWSDFNGTGARFRRIFADGTAAGPTVTLSASSDNFFRVSLIWNGSGYGVAWVAATAGYDQVYFARLTANGTIIGSAQRVSFFGVPPTANSYAADLAWNGSGYMVVWEDDRYGATANDILMTELDAGGNVAGGGTRHDLPVTTAAGYQNLPSLIWSTLAMQYVAIWGDARSSPAHLYGATITPGGAASGFGPVDSTATSVSYPRVVDNGAGLGVVWSDSPGNIYFARLNETGTKYGSDVQLSSAGFPGFAPSLVWTGAEYGAFWPVCTGFGSICRIWYQRVSAAGAAVGANVQISPNGLRECNAAFGAHGYLVEAASNATFEGLVIPWGCGTDSTPPSCPGGYVAYSISGTNATVGWLPSDDQQSDIAYYNVYRNAALVGKTSSTYYNDSGLSLSTSYGYAIQPVNAWQLRNSACTDTIYLTTNSSLTLTMNKSNPAAILNWTDVGASGYRIFRGNDPHVMGQIASSSTQTAQDPNALGDGNSYFYSVDE